MITLHNTNVLNMSALQLRGLSTDIKPIGIFHDLSVTPEISRLLKNGSIFTEIDTGKRFMYDEAHEQWYETSSGGSGGDAQTATSEDIDGIIDNIWA